jgi:hypothetical protein
MNSLSTIRALRACAGFLVGAGIWAINTQFGLILPDVDCIDEIRWSAIASFTAAVLAVFAGIVSGRSAMNGSSETTSRFIGSVSGLAALVFAFALAMQGAASLVLSGCER